MANLIESKHLNGKKDFEDIHLGDKEKNNNNIDIHSTINTDQINGQAVVSLATNNERGKYHVKTKKMPVISGNNVIVPMESSPTENNLKKVMKNSRRSRSRFGRGLAKKGGAGGKGTWGKICEDYGDVAALDPHDPNYDSDNMEDCKIEAITPVLDENDIEKEVKQIVTEYLENGDSAEAIESLLEYNFGDKLFMIVVVAVSLAMERKNGHREMTSVLISDLYGHILHHEEIEKGFDALLQMLPDLMLDTPNADEILGNFIARAVADDCIPPIYVKRSKEKFLVKPQRSSIDQANDLLSTKHGLINVDRIWGYTGGMLPVKYLVNQMHLILEEYLVSNISSDAGSNLIDLDVPHFHHEFVYEAIMKAIEDSKDTTIDKICTLLKYFFDSGVITLDQLKNGYLRVFEEMPDIVIDVPFAYEIFDKFKAKAEELGCFPEELEKDVPVRGRKRFVSEGDGGAIKV